MEIKIPLGVKHYEKITVGEADSAKAFGSGMVDVFATPAMIALLEKAAMNSVISHLPEGYTTVGSEINVKHLKATAIGKCVKAESYLRNVEGKKLTFELHAWDEKGLIGIGTHTRVIIDEKVFMEKIN